MTVSNPSRRLSLLALALITASCNTAPTELPYGEAILRARTEGETFDAFLDRGIRGSAVEWPELDAAQAPTN